MLVRSATVALVLLAAGSVDVSVLNAQTAEQGAMDIDFLFNYYNQDGENSPVTGGIGTEAMDVVGPLVILNWQVS